MVSEEKSPSELASRLHAHLTPATLATIVQTWREVEFGTLRRGYARPDARVFVENLAPDHDLPPSVVPLLARYLERFVEEESTKLEAAASEVLDEVREKLDAVGIEDLDA